MIELFHGSNVEIDKIDLTQSKPGKDFGKGFYLSADYSQALKQANNTTFRTQIGAPIVTRFIFDERCLKNTNLKVKTFNSYSVEWAEFVLKNRKNESQNPTHDYDIVYGPTANDTIGVQIRRYMESYIDIHQLVEALKFLKGITFQYFFGTELAINTLKKA